MSRPAPVPAPLPATSHDVEIVIEDDRWCEDPDVLEVANRAVAALFASHATGLERLAAATVLLSDDAHIAALNTNFRGKTAPTNVLSFPAAPSARQRGEPIYAGDVIIARETVASEAAALGIPVQHHLQHLIVHGLLHLIGYDHLTDADAHVMETLETRILAPLGIADPYAPDPATP